jgi:xanthine dehydrogenase accessory factor
LSPERFPQATQLIHVAYDRDTEHLEPMPLTLTPSTCVVVTTWGWDVPALEQVLRPDTPPGYVGLVASKTKWRVIRQMLIDRGIPEDRVDIVHAPIGLDLGAETPGEIALSIAAEILAVRRKAAARSMKASARSTQSKPDIS